MSRDRQRLASYLAHILDAIGRIARYTEQMTEAEFLADLLVQDAVIRNLEVIGEASRDIGVHYPDFAESNPGLPLALAYEMRNVLAHGYFKVDAEIVWNSIQTDLGPLSRQVTTALAALEGPADR